LAVWEEKFLFLTIFQLCKRTELKIEQPVYSCTSCILSDEIKMLTHTVSDLWPFYLLTRNNCERIQLLADGVSWRQFQQELFTYHIYWWVEKLQ